jgi:hypothetical protein
MLPHAWRGGRFDDEDRRFPPGRQDIGNARSLRNALDRSRLCQARRLLEVGLADTAMLMTIEAADIRASRVFDAARAQGAAEEAPC